MSVFHFKKFQIQQDLCAMKVGTDGVLLGAWVDVENRINALDIGAGTGLLSLMMAQRNDNLKIQAIEIDPLAAEQCLDNFRASPWSDRLTVECISLQNFKNSENKSWDLIVCNPPYFQAGMLSHSDERNTARHAGSLSALDLFAIPLSNCKSDCRFAIIIPESGELKYCREAMDQGWNLQRKTSVITTTGKLPQRVLLEFTLCAVEEVAMDSITIELGARNVWSEEYNRLTRDFYTIL